MRLLRRKAPGQFSPGYTESVALEEYGIFSECENKAPSMNTNKMIIKRKLEGALTRKAPLCSVGRLFVSIGRQLTSARSLIEALNLASPRREGNQGRAERPARRYRPSAAIESGLVLRGRCCSGDVGRSQPAEPVPIYFQSKMLVAKCPCHTKEESDARVNPEKEA